VPKSLPAFIDGLDMDEERRKLIAEMAIVDPTAGGNPVELTVDGALDILDRAMKGRRLSRDLPGHPC
jgi:alcohol dehydrogenase